MSQSIAVLGSNQVPLTYQVPVPGTLTALAATGTFDGSGASEFQPCLSFYDSDGNLLARATAPTVAAGGQAEVSWFPHVGAAAAAAATPLYWLPAHLLWGGPAGVAPDVDLVAAGAVHARNSTAYYQSPGGTYGDALALQQSGMGATILGNMGAKVTDPTAWGDTDVFSVVLSYSAEDAFAGTGPYVDVGLSVGSGYVVKSDGSSFTPCTLIAPNLGSFDGGATAAWAYLYDATGTPIGPTYPWTLGIGDVLAATWTTAVGYWD